MGDFVEGGRSRKKEGENLRSAKLKSRMEGYVAFGVVKEKLATVDVKGQRRVVKTPRERRLSLETDDRKRR